MVKLKFFLDEDVHAALGTILRKRGFDIVHAQEIDRKGKSDSKQLSFAVQRVAITELLLTKGADPNVVRMEQGSNCPDDLYGFCRNSSYEFSTELSALLTRFGMKSRNLTKGQPYGM